jgi:type I restriction enzyme M protein
MLNAETKARIDSARDILVGKVPDPKSQVEQITIALIYKFMDDMDRQSEELGGVATFFSGEFKKYAWPRLLDRSMGGHERLALYAEGIAVMDRNPNIPQLFRDIFKGAFLPYRDPETLNLFLKEINSFSYDHSERLGDAFEYLLSVLGSQGEAGQFRTPRHIIDFIVAIVDPQKHETVADPACGTAGFLISAYKHILAQNGDERPGDRLSGDERARLMEAFCGYDISPDMVRLSRANMYLHGFANPRIHEYDTLTSDDRWDERFDVIMANPPFMTPKGGIRPHSRFSVKSKRSEVLFVDYMAEHLTPSGRAGIIVPEGIIFQSQTAYRQLRKLLVAEYLVAVISLPVGVFHPYAGVKTSILIIDKSLAKRSDTIAFFKVNNDGFDLGAQRRPIALDDLPIVEAQIGEYLRRLRANQSVADFAPTHGWIVPKATVATNEDYHLGGDRYRDHVDSRTSAEGTRVRLGDLLELSGKERAGDRSLPVMSITMKEGLIDQSQKFKKRIASEDTSDYKVVYRNELVVGFPIDEAVLGFQTRYEAAAVSPAYGVWRLRPSFVNRVCVDFLELVLRSPTAVAIYKSKMQGAVSRRRSIPMHIFVDIEIPLPSVAVQKEILAYKQSNDAMKHEIEENERRIGEGIRSIW